MRNISCQGEKNFIGFNSSHIVKKLNNKKEDIRTLRSVENSNTLKTFFLCRKIKQVTSQHSMLFFFCFSSLRAHFHRNFYLVLLRKISPVEKLLVLFTKKSEVYLCSSTKLKRFITRNQKQNYVHTLTLLSQHPILVSQILQIIDDQPRKLSPIRG